MNRIDKKFKELKKANKKAFIPYICFGFPDIKTTKKLIVKLARSGADIIEIGFPFSDPLADGPTIQFASQQALKNKISISKYLTMIREVRGKVDIPLLIMIYYNIIFNYGERNFIQAASKSGLDGVIIPDLPVEEAENLRRLSRTKDFCIINFITPVSSDERKKKIVSQSRGFLYYVSLTGVTGAREKLPGSLKQDVLRLKSITDLPVCVGFGVSKPSHVREITRIADGVIVGSAIIDIIIKNINSKDLVKRVAGFVKELVRQTI